MRNFERLDIDISLLQETAPMVKIWNFKEREKWKSLS